MEFHKIGVWTHIAVSRAGTSLKMFINGAVVVTATNSTNFSDANVRYVGAINGGNFYYFPGYISNLRIVKGLAVYTSAFTSPTAPLTASVSVTTTTYDTVEYLVVAGGGAGGSASNNDTGGGGGAGGLLTGNVTPSSNTLYTITLGAGGTGAAAGTNGGNGINSSISGTGISLTAIGGGGGVFRNLTASAGGSGGGAGSSGSAGGSGTAGPPRQGYDGGTASFNGTSGTAGGGGGAGAVGTSPGPGGVGISSSISGSATYYAGGGGGATSGGTTQAGGTGGGGDGGRPAIAAVVGAVNTGGGAGGVWAPNATPVAGINGGSGTAVIRYPSTLPAALSTTNATMTLAGGYRIYTWTTSGTITFDTFPVVTSTTVITPSSLLLSGTNTGIQDATGKNSLTTVGDARISTAVTKYGTGAMYFDGTGDYLNCGYSPQFEFGTGDFTVECWVYTTSYAATQSLFDSRVQAAVVEANRLVLYILATSGYPQLYDASNDVAVISTIAVPLNTWTHIAFTRNSGTARVFVNGQVGATNASFTTNFLVNKLVIGAAIQVSGGGVYNRNFFNGYIDDYRITKGIARYTTAFVPPSAALGLR